MVHRLEYYTRAELAIIATRTAHVLGVEIEACRGRGHCQALRGTPRIVNRLLRRCRDYAEVKGQGIITSPIADACLALHEVDELGLDALDRSYLESPVHQVQGWARGGAHPWPPPWVRWRGIAWRIWWSPTSCRSASWTAPPRGDGLRKRPTPTSVSRPRRLVPCSARDGATHGISASFSTGSTPFSGTTWATFFGCPLR